MRDKRWGALMKSYPEDKMICRGRAAHAGMNSVTFGKRPGSYDCCIVIVEVTSSEWSDSGLGPATQKGSCWLISICNRQDFRAFSSPVNLPLSGTCSGVPQSPALDLGATQAWCRAWSQLLGAMEQACSHLSSVTITKPSIPEDREQETKTRMPLGTG